MKTVENDSLKLEIDGTHSKILTLLNKESKEKFDKLEKILSSKYENEGIEYSASYVGKIFDISLSDDDIFKQFALMIDRVFNEHTPLAVMTPFIRLTFKDRDKQILLWYAFIKEFPKGAFNKKELGPI